MYDPQWNNMTVDNVTFQTNNVAVLYQNYLKEVWSTAVAYDPFPSTDKTKQRPLKEFLIKFPVLNGQRHFTLDFNTFCSSTGLDYNNGKYVAHPTPEAVKKELSKIVINLSYLDKTQDLVSPLPLYAKPKKGKSQTVTPTLPKSHGPEASKSLFKESKKPKSKKTHAETKATSTPKTIKGSDTQLSENKQPIDMGLTSMDFDEGTTKTTSRPEGSFRNKDLWGNKPPVDMESIIPTVVDPSGTGAKYQVDQTQSTRLRYQDQKQSDEAQESEDDILGAGKKIDEDPQAAKIQHHSSPPQAYKPQSSHAPSIEASNTDSSCDDILRKYDNNLTPTECQLAAVNYANLKASIDEYDNENIAHKDQTDKLVEASMKSLDKISTTISDLYKGLNIIAELLKEINNVVKDDPVINKKISKATEQEKPDESKHLTDANIDFIGSSNPQPSITQAQPITIINPEPIIPQRERKASSKSLRKKRKHIELESEIRIPGLECNRALPENVSFVNNMVIEEPEYGIFFTDEFGDQAFQRWSHIVKVGMEAIVSHLVAAFMV
nr:copia protein [Tanacetum cinerariifolium]